MRTIPFGKPIIGNEEKAAVLDVLSGPILVHGPRSRAFEEDFARFVGGGRAVSVSSCTAAMHLAWFALGLGPGDEVLVPAQTHTATAHAVELTGAKPVFVDAETRTGNLDLDRLESLVTERTRAIAVVHFLGLPVDMDRVNAFARKRGLFVLEDCALAVGTWHKGVHAGLLGDCGCFSFYPVKHMTTAEGGMFLTRDPALAERISRLRAFGVDRAPSERKIPGVYDVTALGFNYRMNEISAVLGIEQLKRVDGFLARRRANAAALRAALSGVDEISLFWEGDADFNGSRYCESVMLEGKAADRRLEIVRYLNDHGVGTSVYYPCPVPLMTYYREKYGYREADFPGASRISFGTVALPVGPHLDEEDMAYAAEVFKRAIAEVNP